MTVLTVAAAGETTQVSYGGTPPPPPGFPQTAFLDEFEGAAVNPAMWSVSDGVAASNELAYRRAANVTVSGGLLRIQPKLEAFGGRQYTSGEITGKVAVQRPFRADAWMSLPHKPNMSSVLWPAWWLRSPVGRGEIDIMEAYGTPVPVHADENLQGRYSIHTYADTNTSAGKVSLGWAIPAGTDLVAFHKYSVAVAADGSCSFLFDDQLVKSVTANSTNQLGTAFAGGYIPKLTLQIGQPSWYGAPIAGAVDWSQQFQVERVAFYKP